MVRGDLKSDGGVVGTAAPILMSALGSKAVGNALSRDERVHASIFNSGKMYEYSGSSPSGLMKPYPRSGLKEFHASYGHLSCPSISFPFADAEWAF